MKLKKKIILMPNSVQNIMSALEVTELMADAIQSAYPDWDLIRMPMTSGGEGSIDAILAAVPGRKIYCETVSPVVGGNTISYFGLIEGDHTALIEIAAAIGPSKADGIAPLTASSYAVGELVRRAMEYPLNRIIFLLEDSLAIDAGTGMGAALGMQFFDSLRQSFIPSGATLADISDFYMGEYNLRLKALEVIGLTDDPSPLLDDEDTTKETFPKTRSLMPSLMAGLKHFNGLVTTKLGSDLMGAWGSGAGGGIGFALAAFYRGKLVPLSMFLLDLENFEKEIRTANAVILGADRFDSEFINAPAQSYIIREAKRRKVPVYAVVTSADPDIISDFRVFVTSRDQGFPERMVSAKEDLRIAMMKLIHELTQS